MKHSIRKCVIIKALWFLLIWFFQRTCKPCACSWAMTEALTTRISEPAGTFCCGCSMLFVVWNNILVRQCILIKDHPRECLVYVLPLSLSLSLFLNVCVCFSLFSLARKWKRMWNLFTIIRLTLLRSWVGGFSVRNAVDIAASVEKKESKENMHWIVVKIKYMIFDYMRDRLQLSSLVICLWCSPLCWLYIHPLPLTRSLSCNLYLLFSHLNAKRHQSRTQTGRSLCLSVCY